MKTIVLRLLFGLVALLASGGASAAPAACDKTCLEDIATRYRAAYLAHDPSLAPFAAKVRFTENNVEMRLPDGTWDTVKREVGTALTVSDPVTGNVAVFTAIIQRDRPGFLAIRLEVRRQKIVEVEHFVATEANVSMKIGDVESAAHDPRFAHSVPVEERGRRSSHIALVDGYFSTLENNDGTLRGLRISPEARRLGNGIRHGETRKMLESGFFRFNERVRDRDAFLVDEARGVVVARVFIDHKGLLDRYRLNDGTEVRSPFPEPHSWAGMELFKIEGGEITGEESIIVHVPYNMPSAWRR